MSFIRGIPQSAWFFAALLMTAACEIHAGDTVGEPGNSSESRIARWIDQLGDADYEVRQKAQAELANLGFEAFDALSAAALHEDLEIASRAKYLLQLMRVRWTNERDPEAVQKCLAQYELFTPEQQQLCMRRLADLPGGIGIPALCRLVRFEQSPAMSKTAAMEILGWDPTGTPLRADLGATIKKHLGNSKRPAAVWLLTYLDPAEDKREMLAAWQKLIEDERVTLRQSPEHTRPELLAAMIRHEVYWLTKLDRRDEAVTAMRTLMGLQRDDPKNLTQLAEWLMRQQAWDVLDELTEQYADRFAQNPNLLYTLAEGYANQGKKDLADRTAEKAFALNPGKGGRELEQHWRAASRLWQKGQLDWALREYYHVVETASPGELLALLAQYELSRILHDQGEHLKAATMLRKQLEALGNDKEQRYVALARLMPTYQSQMYYFFAKHWAERGDHVKEREYLDRALQENRTDIDVLIACYHLPNTAEEYHKKIVELVARVAAESRAAIAQAPDSPSNYNQLAWLIANTEGDLDEALRCSKKSIELAEEDGGYYDTLARCYYAKGDYANAVKFQEKAARLEPHSGLIARQLALFRKALAKQKEIPQGAGKN